ncbi:transcriptional regulator [Sulfolobus sp. A20]|uniref:ArsR family transcriptional regulator n=1 Tax=Saccharolobus sp. A20 TaxID=1891280 RepID=UPI000845CBAD|nr:ArsR family transcriptional regulator [Sulfolobus sp. A20]TRM77939.1 ArsR family transcriptional regulator [Sulfolobus sp. A20-N-F8]TRM81595.1 ArsR family transcriptional regulator [Sulfolobus sp. D5]TRM83429.1 ArsR family transcriptional regulator [Sulfolobus sp. A20-N-F6]TRM87946.1 ArsR family transcriptional regulator [Sulfolobus sp. C3]TRM88811.1 ArsR family transcriptional regulator [Sulfolobus sp. E3]TRN04118.1 ArsR family transcriptional regulator [Sulfolobus sp. E1]
MEEEELSGTARKIYYYLLRQKKAVGIRKIQKDLNLSSPSIVSYHIKRLMEEGLVKETEEGYVVAKIIVEDYVKFKNVVVPRSIFLSSFLLTSLLVLFYLILYHPFSAEIFSVVVIFIVTIFSVTDVVKKYRKLKV